MFQRLLAAVAALAVLLMCARPASASPQLATVYGSGTTSTTAISNTATNYIIVTGYHGPID